MVALYKSIILSLVYVIAINCYSLSETFDLGRTSSTGTTSKVGSKIGKSTGPAERASRHGNRAGASVCFYMLERLKAGRNWSTDFLPFIYFSRELFLQGTQGKRP